MAAALHALGSAVNVINAPDGKREIVFSLKKRKVAFPCGFHRAQINDAIIHMVTSIHNCHYSNTIPPGCRYEQ